MTDPFLLARIAGSAVAIASDLVEAVVDLDAIVPVPAAPTPVLGLSALRSRIVTVVDAGLALGEVPSSGRRAVVVPFEGHDYALSVDAVDDVAPLALRPLPDGLPLAEAWRAAACGVVVVADGDTALVVDPRTLLRLAARAA